MGGLDLQFVRLAKLFKSNDIHFEPGLNEELAATAIWGAQQAEMRGEGKFDGVFGLWYGKGPGVDRSGDVFRHANLAGTSPRGGVLALMGDDHTAESSTTAHQSEFALVDAMMPIFSPAGVQEILDYGALGWALSRYAGVWVGIKCLKDTIESTAVVDASLERVRPVVPADQALPPGGLNIRTPDGILEQEARLHEHKRDAVVAWLQANRINRTITSGGPNAKIGILTAGKSFLDVRQALDDLGVDEAGCNALGLRIHKLGCVWPIAPSELRDFARGLDLVIVVEEKRSLIETQVREELYGSPNAPVCIGKRDEAGQWLFPAKGALDPNNIAIAIGERLLKYRPDSALEARIERLRRAQRALAEIKQEAVRTPYFCSGCPHNRSTVIPEGARAYAGIGCHFMAQYMDRRTDGYTQMGGEGANWVGEARFSRRGHVFQNLGDGTYNHSGALALRWAIDSKVNVTYKILFNDAVAMTGGQRHEGGLTVPQIARQVSADGARQVVVVADDPFKYPAGVDWPAGVTLRPREELLEVEKELSEIPGATVLIYDQTCAAEKRRRRKRGEYPDPDKRVLINELVCEGCGDCGVKSNCVSIQPRETEFGRKRAIDQSSCNKDFSCSDGFCPSFVTVHGARPRKSAARDQRAAGDAGAREARDFQPAVLDRRHRRRRHRGRHHRRHSRHGRASRGQGLRHDRHGRPRAEGRRGVQPRQARAPARGHPRHPRRGRRRRPDPGLRSRRLGRAHRARRDARRRDRRRRQRRRSLPRRLHPQARFRAADRAAEALDRSGERRRRAVRRRDRGRQCAARQRHRRQHVHARLCLSGRPCPAVLGRDTARDRTQWRSGGDEPGRLRLGPRRARESRQPRRHRQAERDGRRRRSRSFPTSSPRASSS